MNYNSKISIPNLSACHCEGECGGVAAKTHPNVCFQQTHAMSSANGYARRDNPVFGTNFLDSHTFSMKMLAMTAICVASISSTSAQERSIVQLPDIVVTANRLATQASQVGNSVTVITSDDIEQKQGRILSDMLRDTPGLNIIQSGNGQAASIFMRGTNSNHTKVLYDGIDIKDPTSANGAFDFSTISLQDIERIEILRGPQSGVYGSDAIGGVINIISKKGTKTPRFVAGVEAGSFGTFNKFVGVSDMKDKVNFSFNIINNRSTGSQVTPLNIVPPGQKRNSELADITTLSSNVGYKFSDIFNVQTTTHYTMQDLAYTTDDFSSIPNKLRSTLNGQQFFTRSVANLALLDNKFKNALGVSYSKYKRTSFNPNTPTTKPSEYIGDRVQFDWLGQFELLKGHNVSLGLEHSKDKIEDLQGAQRTNSAGFVELQSNFFDMLYTTTSIRHDNDDQFGGKTTYRFAPSFVIVETGTKLKGSVGTGFKAPALEQMYRNYPNSNPAYAFYGNPNLKPETSTGYDFGFEQNLFNNKLSFGATHFKNRIQNLIDYNSTYTSLANVARANTYGYESFVSIKPIKDVSIKAEYTHTISENGLTFLPLLRRPNNKASVTGVWQVTEKANIFATLLYTGAWYDIARSGSPSNIKTKSYTTFNIGGAYDFGKGITAFARVENLFNKKYQEPLGFEKNGIGAYAGVKYAFDMPGVK